MATRKKFYWVKYNHEQKTYEVDWTDYADVDESLSSHDIEILDEDGEDATTTILDDDLPVGLLSTLVIKGGVAGSTYTASITGTVDTGNRYIQKGEIEILE